MENLGLPYRIQTLLNLMVLNSETRSHLLLIGPPGSGKTTSAKFFVEAIHKSKTKSSFFGRALFLNSSDERGLDAVRSRVYPFVRSSFKALFSESNSPKIIIFDEAETLTDQAQIALRPLLDESAKNVMIIFLCNSISRIHQSIIHKFLIIPFEAPNIVDFKYRIDIILKKENTLISGLDIQFRRGDIRYFMLNVGKYNECSKLWSILLNTHISQIQSVFETTLQKWTYPDLAMFCVFCANILCVLNKTAMIKILQITDTDFIKLIGFKQRAKLLANWFKQFVREKLESF